MGRSGGGIAGSRIVEMPENAPWTTLFTAGGKEGFGNLLSLFCAVGFSLYVLALAHASGRARFQQLILLQIGFAMFFLTIGVFIMEPVRIDSLTQLVAPGGVLRQPLVSIYLLVAGVLATALAFGVQTWAQQVIPAANIAVILTLEPVFAWLTAFLFLNEKLKLRPGMGAILVLLGIVTAEILPRWRRRNQRSQATAAT